MRFNASMMRDSSPPDAILCSGRGSSPLLAASWNSTRSQPVAPEPLAVEHERSIVAVARRDLRDDGLEPRAVHRQLLQRLTDANPQRARGFHARRRQARRDARRGCARRVQLGGERRTTLLVRRQIAELLAERVALANQIGDVLGVAAMLAQQLGDEIGALVDLRQPLGIGVEMLGVPSQIARRLLQRHARLVDLFAHASELRIDAPELRQLAPDRPSSSAIAPSRE